MKRPDWELFWFTIAVFYSTRGTCPRLHTSCVIVDSKNRMISAGYNGSIPGMEHCDEVGCLVIDGHCVRTFHAEENAIDNAVDLRRLEGATAYNVATPCLRCFKKLVKHGIKRILYIDEHDNYRDETDRAKAEEFIREVTAAKRVEFRRVKLDLDRVIADMVLILKSPGGALYKDES